MTLNILEGLCYLSESKNQEANYKILKEKTDYTYGDDKLYLDYYIYKYNTTGSFPSFQDFRINFAVLDEIELEENSYNRFIAYLDKQEWKALKERMLSTSDKEAEEKILSQMENLFRSSQTDLKIEIISTDDIDINPYLDKNLNGGLRIPIKEIDADFGKLQKGLVMGVLAKPGSGKTSLAVNCCYHNSFLDSMNGLYFYLEDIDRRYYYQLLSRRSYDTGDRIPAKLMKQGFVDDASKKKFIEFEQKYRSEKRGNLYFTNMQSFSNDPYIFGLQFSHLLKEKKIDYFVFDYLQRMKDYLPAKTDELKYLNKFGSILSSVALGQFNGYRTAGIVLSQINKEAERKAERTGGKIALSDAAECSCIARDFQLVIHTFVDPVLAESNEMKFQVLKSRDSALDSEPHFMSCSLEYAYIGEMAGIQDVYNDQAVVSMADTWKKAFE